MKRFEKMNKRLKKQLGFTLIELMIVVAIIGILAAIAIPNFLRFQAKAKQSEAKVMLSGIYTAETSYFAENNTYHTDLINKVGFEPASSPKYYNPALGTNAFIVAATATSFSGQASGNIDSDPLKDSWTISDQSREPQPQTNDVILP